MGRRRIDEFLGEPVGRSNRLDAATGTCRAEQLEEIVEALRALGEKIDEVSRKCLEAIGSLRREVEELRSELSSTSAHQRSRPARLKGSLRRLMRDIKYVMASEARVKLGVSPQRLRIEAGEEGLIVLEAGKDFAVLLPSAYEEFKARLASVKTADAVEAAREMGEYARLFEALREGGQVYYDARRRRWLLLEA